MTGRKAWLNRFSYPIVEEHLALGFRVLHEFRKEQPFDTRQAPLFLSNTKAPLLEIDDHIPYRIDVKLEY